MRPYLHLRLVPVLRPVLRLRPTVALPAIFFRQTFAALLNALRAAFGVLNFVRLITATIHFLYPRAPPATRRDARLLVDLRRTMILSPIRIGVFAPTLVLGRKVFKPASKHFLLFHRQPYEKSVIYSPLKVNRQPTGLLLRPYVPCFPYQ